jgi:hypothetical protein
MSYAAFRFFVTEIKPWIRLKSLMFVRKPMHVDMIVSIVVFRLAHGLFATLLADKFGVRTSTIHKYIDLVINDIVPPPTEMNIHTFQRGFLPPHILLNLNIRSHN